MKANFRNTAVIIPMFNVEDYLNKLLSELKKFFPVSQIYAVDDASEDNTSKLCLDNKIHLVTLNKNQGKGNALQVGFQNVIKDNFDFAFTIDGDLQHNPLHIPDFINSQNENNFDIVIGKRDFNRIHMPITRIFSNFLTSKIVSFLTKTEIPDSQCGYRLYNLQLIKAMIFRTKRYQFETEIIIKTVKAHGKIGSIPIETIYNEQKSYISHWRDIKNFVDVIYFEILKK